MNRIEEKIRVVEEYSMKAEENLPNTYQEFQDLDIEKEGVYKSIEVAIQASYDICALIIKEEKLRVPGDEESLPGILEEEDIIDAETADKLKDMKGFRNALAHRYGKINDEIAYENIQSGLQDFPVFIEQIKKYLKTNSQPKQ